NCGHPLHRNGQYCPCCNAELFSATQTCINCGWFDESELPDMLTMPEPQLDTEVKSDAPLRKHTFPERSAILIGKQKYIMAGFGSAILCAVLIFLIAPHGTRTNNSVSKKGIVTSQLPYTNQIASFRDEKRAIYLIQELRNQGFEAYLVDYKGEKSRWYRVRLGQYNDIASARHQADSLILSRKISEYFVTRFEDGYYYLNK
ncbi:SPOR domain-containing protein, partial [bacterium]|nr:SPOR domain-containing protein [bacterium]